MEILKDNIFQLNFHTFIRSWAQFEELYGPFVNLGAHLSPKHNSLKTKKGRRIRKGKLPQLSKREGEISQLSSLSSLSSSPCFLPSQSLGFFSFGGRKENFNQKHWVSCESEIRFRKLSSLE